MGEWSSDPTSSTEEVTVGLRRYLKFTWLYPHLKSVVPLCTTMWVEHHFPLLNHLTVWQNHSEAVWKSFSSLNSSHPSFCFSHLLSHVCLACVACATLVAQANQVFYSSIALFTFCCPPLARGLPPQPTSTTLHLQMDAASLRLKRSGTVWILICTQKSASLNTWGCIMVISKITDFTISAFCFYLHVTQHPSFFFFFFFWNCAKT